MSTSQTTTGSNQYPHLNLIAPMGVLDIKVYDPNDLTKFSDYHITNELGNRIDAHSIRSICEVSNKKWIPLKGGTHFMFPIEMFDLYNHINLVKTLLQAYGYVLGGEDFNNPNPMAFWLFEYGLLLEFLDTSVHNQEVTL